MKSKLDLIVRQYRHAVAKLDDVMRIKMVKADYRIDVGFLPPTS